MTTYVHASDTFHTHIQIVYQGGDDYMVCVQVSEAVLISEKERTGL